MRIRRDIIAILSALLTVLLALGVFAQSDSRADRRERLRICRNWLRSAGEFQAKGEYVEAMHAADSALACDERNPDAYYILGTIRAKLGDTLAAKNALHNGVDHSPLSARLKLKLARLCVLTGERAFADSLIEATLAFKPREPEALYLKALSQLYHGDTTSALELFDKALSISLKKNGE